MTLDHLTWIKMVVLFVHLLLSALALSQVLRADLMLIRGQFSRSRLRQLSRQVVVTLCALWVSGLVLVYLDIGFDIAALQAKSKLLLKLVCVLVLTLNGVILHYVSFPVLLNNSPITRQGAVTLALSGSVSTSHWLLAAFIGVSTPLAQMQLNDLLRIYAMTCAATLVVALLCIPWVRSRITDQKLTSALRRKRRRLQRKRKQSALTTPSRRPRSSTRNTNHDAPSAPQALPG